MSQMRIECGRSYESMKVHFYVYTAIQKWGEKPITVLLGFRLRTL